VRALATPSNTPVGTSKRSARLGDQRDGQAQVAELVVRDGLLRDAEVRGHHVLGEAGDLAQLRGRRERSPGSSPTWPPTSKSSGTRSSRSSSSADLVRRSPCSGTRTDAWTGPNCTSGPQPEIMAKLASSVPLTTDASAS
jgi:hypothetical protein